jgi:hypothetical protein
MKIVVLLVSAVPSLVFGQTHTVRVIAENTASKDVAAAYSRDSCGHQDIR